MRKDVEALFTDKVECIKTVEMDVSGEITFVEGKTYKAKIGRYIDAINEQGESHGIGERYHDEFFKEHFRIVE